MKRIVISGGTYAGKTSLIELFKKDGFEVVPDVGLEVIKELNAELGQDGQREFRANNPIEFYSKIIRKQLEIEKSFGEKTVIYDRGVHDYVAMLRFTGTRIPDSLMSLVRGISYDLVFVCSTLLDFDERKSSGRSLTKDNSLRLKDLITETYQNLGCRVIQLKEMPLDQRYDFVRSHLNSSDFHEVQQKRPKKTHLPRKIQKSLKDKAIELIKSKLLPDSKIIKIVLIGSSLKGTFGEYEPPGFRGSLFSDFDFIVFVDDDYEIPDWMEREPDGKPFPDDKLNLAYRNKRLIDDKYDVEVFFIRWSNMNNPIIQKQGEEAGIPMTKNTKHKHEVIYLKEA